MDGKVSAQKALAGEELAAVGTRVLVGGGRQVMLQRLRGRVLVAALRALKVAERSTHTFMFQ